MTEYLDSLDPTQFRDRYKTFYEDPETWNRNYKQYGGNEEDEVYRNAYNSARSLLGRDVTEAEFAQIVPYFIGPNGQQTGRAYLSQLAEADKNSPDQIKKRSGQYGGDVNRIFSEMLGRNANQDEAQYFGSMLASGVSPYELNYYVQQLPEYRNTQDTKFREGLNSEIGGYDQEFFNKAKEDVISRYAKNGQTMGNSPALDFALAQVAGDLAKERGRYLAGISADQYGGNKNLAREDYLGNMGRYVDDQNYARGRRDNYSDALLNRSWNAMDYKTQREDYERQAAQARQGQNTFHTRDWVNMAMFGANTAGQAYMNSQGGGGGGYSHMGGGGFSPYSQGGMPGPYSYGR